MVALKLVECASGNCSSSLSNYNDLLSQIDSKLHKISMLEYNNNILFLKKKSNCIYCDIFEDLKYYQIILHRKLSNDECLRHIDIKEIISKIKRLINT